jgi:putative tryptophan/tyrosine transport system substrate-binding protein
MAVAGDRASRWAERATRRDIVALLLGAGAALAAPRAVAQEETRPTRRIGVLMPTPENDPETAALGAEFRRALQDLNWVAGRNLRIDYRWGAGDPRRIAAFAQELVALAPDAILAGGAPAVAPLKRATSTIPIVFISVTDPVAQGFVQSLAHPGGNITGFTNFDPSTGGRWLALLKQVAPAVQRVAVLYNPATAPYTESFLQTVAAVAGGYGVTTAGAPVSDVAAIDRVLATLGEQPGGGLLVPSDAFTYSHASEVADAAARHRVPAIYAFRVFAASGGLMSYGVDLVAEMRQAASYVDRVMSGTSPADLPVQVPNKFELLINLKAAKALGLTIPPTVLASADEVIE